MINITQKNSGRKPGKDLGGRIKPDFYNQRGEQVQDDVDIVIAGNKNLEQLYIENEPLFNEYLDEVGGEYHG